MHLTYYHKNIVDNKPSWGPMSDESWVLFPSNGLFIVLTVGKGKVEKYRKDKRIQIIPRN